MKRNQMERNLSIYLVLLSISTSFSYLHSLIDRPDEVKYSIVTLGKHQIDHAQLSGTVVEMTSPQTKAKFDCYIPHEKPDVESANLDPETEVPISTLLESLHGACLIRVTGWWNYEFCYQKHLKQYHQEGNKPVRPQDEYFLGKYNPEKEGVENKEYYSETYTDGTVCDITGRPRTTEIRYYCNDKTGNIISDVKEPSSCDYVVTILTPHLCKYHAYKPKKEKVETIYCVAKDEDAVLPTDEKSEKTQGKLETQDGDTESKQKQFGIEMKESIQDILDGNLEDEDFKAHSGVHKVSKVSDEVSNEVSEEAEEKSSHGVSSDGVKELKDIQEVLNLVLNQHKNKPAAVDNSQKSENQEEAVREALRKQHYKQLEDAQNKENQEEDLEEDEVDKEVARIREKFKKAPGFQRRN